ncbi:MAG: polysaccharide biosynthesis tyrosine autokinase [Clostridiales bacterium]|nr:polysaccharide biosynthesis tyrosine autokinase [Clostridiales bacterium]
MEDVTEISLQQLFALLLKNKLLLILFSVFGVLISLCVTTFVLKNQFESNVKLYVYVPPSEQQSLAQDISAVNYAQKVVNTYIQMMDTRSFYKQIADESGLPYTAGQVSGMITFSVLGATEVFEAKVTAGNPEDALSIAQSIAVIAPRVIQSIQESASLKIVDPAVINNNPVSPNLRLNLIIGFLAGLAIAAVFVFIRDMLDTKIKNGDELSDRYGIHILAAVGDISEEERKKGSSSSVAASNPTIAPEHMEAYRTARTNLNFSVLNKGCKKIAIVSSLPKEGKTTTSVHIATALAQQLDTTVLLIDCDLRKPRIHRYYKLQNTPGLTDYLSGMNPLEDVLKKTQYENLTLISAGTVPPNPSELLASHAFTSFIEMMNDSYDFIIIDTSPLNLVSDAISIARLMDGCVISAVQGASVHPEVARTLELLKNAEAKITGVVLHGVERGKKRGSKSGYGYEYGYGYYNYQ